MRPSTLLLILTLAPLAAFIALQTAGYMEFRQALAQHAEATEKNQHIFELAQALARRRNHLRNHPTADVVHPSVQDITSAVASLLGDPEYTVYQSQWNELARSHNKAIHVAEGEDQKSLGYTKLINRLGLIAHTNFLSVPIAPRDSSPIYLLERLSTESAISLISLATLPNRTLLFEELHKIDQYTQHLKRYGVSVVDLEANTALLRNASKNAELLAEQHRVIIADLLHQQLQADLSTASWTYAVQLVLGTLVGLATFLFWRRLLHLRRAQRDSARRLALTAEATRFGIWMRHMDSGKVEFSAELRKILALRPDEPARSIVEFVHDDDFPEAEKQLSNALTGEPGRIFHQTGRVRVGAEYRWMAASFAVVVQETGNVLVGVLRDTHDQQLTTDELALTREDLAARNTELQHFARSTAHDLREPIRIMGSFAKLLKNEPNTLTEDSQRYLKYLIDGADRAHDTLDRLQNLLSMTRLGVPQPVDLQACLDEAASNLQHAIAQSDAQIFAEPLPWVMGHASALTSLLENLISNSIKYVRPSDRPNLAISYRLVNGRCHVVAADQGIGIDAAHHDEVFEPFTRLHTREEYPGTGLGLSLCKRAVELAGGEIWIESEAGAGTAVHVMLAIAEQPAQYALN